jgi:copper(I)-binding protein
MNKTIIYMMILVILLTVSACQANQASIVIEDIWARPGLTDGNSAVFFKIINSSMEADQLLNARSNVASAVELHKTTMIDGVMKMEPQTSVSVPAGEPTIFKPGDLHVMLIGLTDPLNAGDEFQLTLNFKIAGEININVIVQEP